MKTLNQTKAELKSYIINCIKDGQIDSVPVSEIHNELFNTDYYICGYYDAEKWLIENGGIFNAITEIVDYEKNIYGEVNTNLTNSETVCNMYAYIIGEDILNNCETIQDNIDNNTTPEILSALIEELEKD
jgi:hypothetical protein